MLPPVRSPLRSSSVMLANVTRRLEGKSTRSLTAETTQGAALYDHSSCAGRPRGTRRTPPAPLLHLHLIYILQTSSSAPPREHQQRQHV